MRDRRLDVPGPRHRIPNPAPPAPPAFQLMPCLSGFSARRRDGARRPEALTNALNPESHQTQACQPVARTDVGRCRSGSLTSISPIETRLTDRNHQPTTGNGQRSG